MTKIHNFIQHSGFKSIGNDAQATVILNIPDSFTMQVFGSGDSMYAEAEFHADVVVGKTNAPVIVQMNNSRQSEFTTPATSITVKADHLIYPDLGDAGELLTMASIYRLNPTTIRLTCSFALESNEPINITGAAQTVTAKIRTFIDPFQS